LTEHDDVTGAPMVKIRSENAAKQRFLKKCTTLIMMIRFAPNKNNNWGSHDPFGPPGAT